MSLKSLRKKIESKQLSKGGVVANTAPSSGYPAFLGLDYNLPFEQLNLYDLTDTIKDILSMLEEAKKGQKIEAHQPQNIGLSDTIKKKLILIFYRLAFAQESRAVGCFHPSEISQESSLCHRKMYYQYANVRKDATYVPFTSDNRMMRLVDLGTLLHLYVQENLDRLGILIDMEIPAHDPSIGISGKADGAVHFQGKDDLGNYYDEPMILEVKSINEYGFKALRRAKPEHVKQASIYGGVLKYKRIVFVYYNKNTSDLKIYVENIDYNYFDGFSIEAKKVIASYNTNKRKSRSSDITKHDLPKGVCPAITSNRATECPYRDTCFK